MQVGIELLNKGEICGLSVFIQILNVEAKGRDNRGMR